MLGRIVEYLYVDLPPSQIFLERIGRRRENDMMVDQSRWVVCLVLSRKLLRQMLGDEGDGDDSSIWSIHIPPANCKGQVYERWVVTGQQ